MKSITLTRGKVALVDDADYEWLNQWKWVAYKSRKTFYASHTGLPDMHRLIMNAPKGMVVDHINMNGLDNRRENLRLCTITENNRHRRMRGDNKTGYMGVSLKKSDNKYRARIKINNKEKELGFFNDPVEAAKAYDEAAKKYHGKFAFLNFPD